LPDHDVEFDAERHAEPDAAVADLVAAIRAVHAGQQRWPTVTIVGQHRHIVVIVGQSRRISLAFVWPFRQL
jgi:hypothetical protein